MAIKNFTFKVFGWFILLFFVFSFFTNDFVYAGYQKIAPGDTITLGEFVFDDNFVATTTPCTIGITNPLNVVVAPSTTPMTANNDGWHYYTTTTAADAASGIWPSFMICGSVSGGDLVKVDKSFIVDSSMVTKSYIDTATSTLTAEIAKGYTVTLSDFEGTTVNTLYKAKLQVLNYAAVPTNADSLPTVDIITPLAVTKVSNGVMATTSLAGTYSYSYTIVGGGENVVGGVWETVVSVVVNGQTIRLNDYWNLSSAPADVQIIDITDKIIPRITASVRIDNKGTVESDFYYVYCIVSSESNLCGGNDDVVSGSATEYIDVGGFINPQLTLDDVPTAGTYWFKVKARALAETNWAAATTQFTAESGTAAPPPASPPSGGGGGSVAPITAVIFSGRAYPKSSVTLLKDAQIAATTVAGQDANFQITLFAISTGNYNFSLHRQDSSQRRSNLLTFPVTVTAGATTKVAGIFIAPTIDVDKSTVKRGETIAILGQTVSNAEITIIVSSDEEHFAKITADSSGAYLYNFDSTPLEIGQHLTKSKAAVGSEISSYSQAVTFNVGAQTIKKTAQMFSKGDVNSDGKVNLVDFSIAAYWYKRPLSEAFKKIEEERLNGDGKLDLTDLSIIAYYWTG